MTWKGFMKRRSFLGLLGGIFIAPAILLPTTTYRASKCNTVFDESGTDNDFRIEGGSEAHVLFIDASSDAISIGCNSAGVVQW